MFKRGRVARWALLAISAFGLMTFSQAAPVAPPVENFTRWPAIVSAAPSPSGRRLALILQRPDGRLVLAVRQQGDRETKVVAVFNDASIFGATWVNEDRLVYSASAAGPVINEYKAGLFACNFDGSAPRQLVQWQYSEGGPRGAINLKVLPYGWFLHSTVDDGSDDVFIRRRVTDAKYEFKQNQLARLNTRTGQLRTLSAGAPPHASTWLLDAAGEPRVIGEYRDGSIKHHWRNPTTDLWEAIDEVRMFAREGIEPKFVDNDGRLIVVSAGSGDTTGYYMFDPSTRQMSVEPLFAIKGFDMFAAPVNDSRTRELLGIKTIAIDPLSYWFDDRLRGVQKMVDEALPGRVNDIACGRCKSTDYFTVFSQSDRAPGTFYVFDAAKKTLDEVGATRPWIEESTQGRRTFHRVQARDGLSVPVYVTHPTGAAETTTPLPAVVLVHDGPDRYRPYGMWSIEAQFLASRGYRVIEPEYRGSSGFGYEHFRRGWKEWGGAMQNDLVDAVNWASKEGLIDAASVCVMGTGYGGYAALMAAGQDPTVFKCAISYSAATDLLALYDEYPGGASGQNRKYYLPQVVGDPEKDREMLSARSPVNLVAKIKAPLLVAHGTLDRRTPIKHASTFVSAAQRAGVNVEYVSYDEAGGWNHIGNRTDFLTRTEKLLADALRRSSKTSTP